MNGVLDVRNLTEILPPSEFPENSRCGSSISLLPDLDGDGMQELLIGCAGSTPEGRTSRIGATGRVILASLANMIFDTLEERPFRRAIITTYNIIDGTKIPPHVGNFTASLDSGDQFGYSVVYLGDIDNNNVGEFIIGAPKHSRGIGSMYIFSIPIPIFDNYPESAASEGGGGLPSWIAGPVLGALAIPTALLLRRRNKKHKAKLIKSEHHVSGS